MKLQDFRIGMEFVAAGGFRWRCTDVGTRTISAIMLDPDKTSNWFDGPPYAVQEVVFDEDDMLGCGSNLNDLIGQRLATNWDPDYGHPGFDIDNMAVMFHPSTAYPAELQKVQQWKGLMKRDRVDESGVVWHPYHAARGLLDPRVVAYPQTVTVQDMSHRLSLLTNPRIADGDWYLLVFSPMLLTYSAVHPETFLQWRLATHTDYPKTANPFCLDATSDDNPDTTPSIAQASVDADVLNLQDDEGSLRMQAVDAYTGMTADYFSHVLKDITAGYTDGKNFECFYYGPDKEIRLGLEHLDLRHTSELKMIRDWNGDMNWRVATSLSGDLDTLPQWDGYAIRIEYGQFNTFMHAALTSVVAAHNMYYDDIEADVLFEDEQAIGAEGLRSIIFIARSIKNEHGKSRLEGYLFAHRVAVDMQKLEASRAVDPTMPMMQTAATNVIMQVISDYGFDIIHGENHSMD